MTDTHDQEEMRQQLSNAIYGLLDYAAYPIGMLAVAPFILHNLGVAQYGIWTVTTSMVSLGSIVASGFGDANIQKVATNRGAGSTDALLRVVRAAMGIHLLLGVVMAIAICGAGSMLAGRLAAGNGVLRNTCFWSIELAGILTAIRAIETVCISTQRAFERYGAAVKISVASRLLSLGAAAILAGLGQNVAVIMASTVALVGVALVLQIGQLQRLLETRDIAPSFESAATKDLISFGIYTWILAVTGVIFGQADRLIGGASMGAAAVVSYALCTQISQPVYGLTAAGLHFLFPYFANRSSNGDPAMLAKALRMAITANVILVLAGAGMLLVLSDRVFHLLANDAIARACSPLLPPVLASSALLGLSVTGSYAMVALGRVRPVALINVIAAAVVLLVAGFFMSRFGVKAIIGGRLAFALIALLVYIPLLRLVPIATRRARSDAFRKTVVEEA